MDVSIVIPTRDRPHLLALTLWTALHQDGVDTEVLVVDDGATPGTARLCAGIPDGRLRALRNTGPAGVSGARNTGITAARGRWIAFLDDDDLWAPGKLAVQVAAAEAEGAGWVYAGDVTLDERLAIVAGGPPPPPATVMRDLRDHNAVPAGASNVVVRRDLLAAAGLFDPDLRTSEDWDQWLRLAALGTPACVPRPLVALRAHAGMASRNADQMLRDVRTVSRRHGLANNAVRHRRWAAWMALEDGHRFAAVRHYAAAVAAGDLASLGRAAFAVAGPRRPWRRSGPDPAWARDAQAWLDALPQQAGDTKYPEPGPGAAP